MRRRINPPAATPNALKRVAGGGTTTLSNLSNRFQPVLGHSGGFEPAGGPEVGAVAVGAVALGAVALGTVALGAVALGTATVG